MESETDTNATFLCVEGARKAARSLTAEERGSLREAGRRKLEQYRLLKQKLNGGLGDAITAAGFGISISGEPSTPSLPTIHHDSAAATSQEPPAADAQQSIGASRSSGVADQVDAPADPAAAVAAAADPMVDLLLAQVSSLMQERQAWQTQADQLRRENEQLHELVGYLSLQQGVSQQSGEVPSEDMQAWDEPLMFPIYEGEGEEEAAGLVVAGMEEQGEPTSEGYGSERSDVSDGSGTMLQ